MRSDPHKQLASDILNRAFTDYMIEAYRADVNRFMQGRMLILLCTIVDIDPQDWIKACQKQPRRNV